MPTTYNVNGRRLAGGLTVLLLLFIFVAGTKAIVTDYFDPIAEAAESVDSSACAQGTTYFYRHDLPPDVDRFGPGVPEEVSAARTELLKRVCEDPALTTALTWYARREYRTAEIGLRQTQTLINDRNMWAGTVNALNERWNSATNVEVVDMSGPYKTMYMSLAPIPLIYQDAVDRPTFKVLRFTYNDGTTDNLKLDCGYQPVEMEFPGLPGRAVQQFAPQVTPSAPSHGGGGGGGPTPGPTPTTTPPRVPVKGPDPGLPPCRDGCDSQGSAGGEPGSGGAIIHDSSGYAPGPGNDRPTPKVNPEPAPPSTRSIPGTTSPPTTKISRPGG